MIFEGKSQSVGLLPGKNDIPTLQIGLQLVSVIHFFSFDSSQKIVGRVFVYTVQSGTDMFSRTALLLKVTMKTLDIIERNGGL